jgi:hypothetical protein
MAWLDFSLMHFVQTFPRVQAVFYHIHLQIGCFNGLFSYYSISVTLLGQLFQSMNFMFVNMWDSSRKSPLHSLEEPTINCRQD